MGKEFHVALIGKNGIVAEFVTDRKGRPVIYRDAEAANSEAAMLSRTSGHKYQPRPVLDDKVDWRKREIERFKKGEYKLVPWHNEDWVKEVKDAVDHFVHVSQDDPTKIAFTECEEKGKYDKQVRMAPTKYLQKFYAKVVSTEVIRKWIAAYKKEFGSNYELKLAYTEEEIIEVYKYCSSCMTGLKAVRAFSGPDLAVAYLEVGKRVTARCVVWPEKKLHCTNIYGDRDLMREALQEEGYAESYRFQGARLQKIKYDGKNGYEPYCSRGYIRPSIEFASQGLNYDGEFITVV